MDHIKAAQESGQRLLRAIEQVVAGLRTYIVIHEDGSLHFDKRICVPEGDIRAELLTKAHSSQYSIHPGGTKMYKDLRMNVWWHGMMRSVAKSVVVC